MRQGKYEENNEFVKRSRKDRDEILMERIREAR